MKAILFALAGTMTLAFAGPISNGNFDGNPGNQASINPWTVNRWSPIALSGCSLASSTTVNCASTTGLAAGMVISGAGLSTSPANSTLVVTTPITSTSFTVTGGTITVCPSALTASYLYPIPNVSATRFANSTVPNPNATPYSLRVDGRGAAADGPKESIGGGLVNGTRYTTRFYIKLDAPAQVRCLVQLSGVGTVPPILMAETVIRSSQIGQWVLVQGTNTVSWSGTLAGAQVYFAVEQLYPLGSAAPAGTFPGYYLDDVQMDVDTDGDGLSDSDETTIYHTNPLLADSDGDGIPDGWAVTHGLDPLGNVAALDPDGDGYTNRQEYWANTDPQNFNEHPGMPGDALATPQTRALLRYLHMLPSRTVAHLLDGQEAAVGSAGDYATYVQGLANAMQTATGTARWPAMLGLFCEQVSQNGPMEVLINGPIGRSYMDAGGLAVLSWAPYNPWTGQFVGDKTGVDIPNLLTPGTAANVRFTGWMDQIAAEIALFGADRPVVFRPLSEMNGGWDWYGHLTQDDFVALWRWMRAYFVQTKGLHNIIWTYECHMQAHLPTDVNNAGYSMDYYWPGDDVVDLVGYSVYTHNWDAAFDTDAQSRLHPKAFAITEGGPPTQPDGLAPNDYNTRYVPQCAAKYPRAAFFIIWNSFPVWNQQTQTSSHNYLAIVDNPNYVALLTDPAIVNRDSVYWRTPSGLAANAASSSQVALNWTPVAGAMGYSVEVSTDGLHAWTPAAAPGTASATIGGFAAATTRFFRVRAIYPDGDSDTTDVLSAITFTSLQEWSATQFGNANAPLLGDTDHDGLVDLVEYALGLDPHTVSQPPVQSFVNVSGANYLALTFRRRVGPSGVSTIVEATGNLVAGLWQPDPVQFGAPVDNGDGTETVTFRDIVPLGSVPLRMMRLRVTAP